ncbi:MAG: DedA family protein [Halobacteriovoraceae bacterium]|jgi:membrane protein DedA with SNARE-associated domain|nr:DedA family protein [Halobacteriovoraceae bacterium]
MPDIDIVQFFAEYAYQPMWVYSFIVLFMTASSFGLPVPEELTLVSAGLVAFMAANPSIYPPPYPGAEGVNLFVLSVVCFFSVLGSDIFIYFIGKFFGQRLLKTKFFHKNIGHDRFDKINKLFNKYSYWACGLFRFTPGIRFPGHLSCGLMGVSIWQFLLIDGLAALISVPTQVILVASYGEIILDKIKEIKIFLLGAILVVVAYWILKKTLAHYKLKRAK